MHHVTQHVPAKTGEYPNFQNFACCENFLKDNKYNNLHLA